MQAPSVWKISDPADGQKSGALASALNIPPALAGLLVQRGFDSADQARVFLRPSLDMLSDPMSLVDMDRAVELIVSVIQSKQTIMVHGDYDVDGQSATALLTRVLRAADADVVPFVPNRIRDGYDLSSAGVAHAVKHGVKLILTCDCGVTAHEAVAEARGHGIMVIVTDHHITTDLPPADAVVNPNRSDCPSGATMLCGTGVAFKLAQALVKPLSLPENLPFHLLDLVALATVADLVPLVGENRTLVKFGLKVLADSRWPGVRALVESAALKDPIIKAGHVGFILAPRLNAIGRIGDAIEGLNLLLCDDERDAGKRARALEKINAERQEMDREILRQAVDRLETTMDLNDTLGIVLADENWHPGVIGIVASRVVERYARPTILIGVDGETGKGSGRSVPGFDLHHALTVCGDHLIKYGGHKMAAGLSISRDKIGAFSEAFNQAVKEELDLQDLVHIRRVDQVVPVASLDGTLERLLRHFEPSGMGNPAPVFAVKVAGAINAREVGDQHLKFTITDDTGRIDAIGFGLYGRVEPEWLTGSVDVAFRLEENQYRGTTSLQARVLDLKPSS